MKEVDKQQLLEEIKKIINRLEADDLIEVRCSCEKPDVSNIALNVLMEIGNQFKPSWKEVVIKFKG